MNLNVKRIFLVIFLFILTALEPFARVEKDLESCIANWSMPSLVFCCALLEFFVQYLENIGETGQLHNYRDKLKILKNSLHLNFWNEKSGSYDWFSGEHGKRPRLPIANFLLMPVYFHYTADLHFVNN